MVVNVSASPRVIWLGVFFMLIMTVLNLSWYRNFGPQNEVLCSHSDLNSTFSSNNYLNGTRANQPKVQFLHKWLKDYASFHNKVMSGEVEEDERRYLVCSPSNGMGNFVQALVGCVLYSMLSNRAILVDMNHQRWIPDEIWTDIYDKPLGGIDVNYTKNFKR